MSVTCIDNVADNGEWFAELLTRRSRGSESKRPGSLAGLAAARAQHEGQFFTPRALACLLWRIVRPAIDAAIAREGEETKVSILDNTCGIGRLFFDADPKRHVLVGADVDVNAIKALSDAAARAGFEHDFRCAPLEQTYYRQVGVALLNPPFGITLQSPYLKAIDGVTTWGSFGKDTSAPSELYAIAQALRAADVIAAIVPERLLELDALPEKLRNRLVAVLRLPGGLFREENTGVRVGVLVFGSEMDAGLHESATVTLTTLDAELPNLPLRCRTIDLLGPPRVHEIAVDESTPSILEPVTGDKRVNVAHDGRKIILTFRCGLTRARVMNAVLRERIVRERDDRMRLPSGVRYAGQGALDLETHLVQIDPIASFRDLVAAIRKAGGSPKVDPGIEGFLRRRIRRDRIARVPLQKTVARQGSMHLAQLPIGSRVTATAKAIHLLEPTSWTGEAVMPKTIVELEAFFDNGQRRYRIHRDRKAIGVATLEAVEKHYTVETLADTPTSWVKVHDGRRIAFPQVAAQIATRARALGLDRILSYGFQFDDVVELAMSDRGMSGWMPALGKTRLAFALCMLGGEHNLIVVEQRLVGEMCDQLAEWGVDPALYQVIDSPARLATLRKVNIIAYERLRAPICTGAGRRTYARSLRKRLATLVCDEAKILANRNSLQTRALFMLSPKRRYALDGSPITTYCQNILHCLYFVAGDGVARMRYGHKHPYLEPVNRRDMTYSRRGEDEFRERHVTVEWTTREWEEELLEGAARQVPRLRDVEGFRELIDPHVLRRVKQEPDVAQHMRIPEPTRILHTLQWDPAHLARYIHVAREFAAWYSKAKEGQRNLNLLMILARIQAVQIAANAPGREVGRWRPYGRLTSKHRKALELLSQFTREGHKTVLFARNPETVDCLARECASRGLSVVRFHGGIPIAERTVAVNDEFKRGSTSITLATYGVATRGHNWPCASRAIIYERCWVPDIEEQAGCRLLRSTQTKDVEFHTLHLEGSIDEYQAQHCEMKAEAIAAGLDYGDQSDNEFLHVDTIFSRFVEDLKARWGLADASTDEFLRIVEEAA